MNKKREWKKMLIFSLVAGALAGYWLWTDSGTKWLMFSALIIHSAFVGFWLGKIVSS